METLNVCALGNTSLIKNTVVYVSMKCHSFDVIFNDIFEIMTFICFSDVARSQEFFPNKTHSHC